MEELLGREVLSVKGRDRGKHYVVVEIIDVYFVRVADGEQKTVSSPKRKNKKHIVCTENLNPIPMDWTETKQGDDRIKQFLTNRKKEV